MGTIDVLIFYIVIVDHVVYGLAENKA